MNIYEANPDGSDLKALTSGPAYHAECAYSPDGTKIVYAANETGDMHLYIMDADGSNSQRLTYVDSCYHGGPFFSPNGEEIIFRCDRQSPHYLQLYRIRSDGSDEQQLTDDGAVNWAPYWHPNGKVIAYTTSLHGHQHYEIYLLNVETMVKYRLTHNSTFDGLPSFNRDGSKILWTSKRADNCCHIFMADFTLPKELQ
jgi:Tol biopolymer transport system component